MNKIAVLASTAVLAVVGGSTAALAYASSPSGAPSGASSGRTVRAVLGNGQGPAFVRSGSGVVPVSAGDDHRRRGGREAGDDHGRRGGREAEPGDDHGTHVEPGDDHGGGREAEPGDDHGTHVEPGDDHGGGREAEPGDDHHGGGSDD